MLAKAVKASRSEPEESVRYAWSEGLCWRMRVRAGRREGGESTRRKQRIERLKTARDLPAWPARVDEGVDCGERGPYWCDETARWGGSKLSAESIAPGDRKGEEQAKPS